METSDLDQWFTEEILTLEPMLMGFLRRNWQDAAEVDDLRQEVYIRLYEAAAKQRPTLAKAFLFQIARNLIMDCKRHRNIVPMETVANFEIFGFSTDEPSPEQRTSDREEIRHLQKAIDSLPPRCREVILMRKVWGLSQRQVASRMGITEDTVERQVSKGIEILGRETLRLKTKSTRAVGGPISKAK